jgi:hypothetical protein
MLPSVNHPQALHGVAGRSIGEDNPSEIVGGYPRGLALVVGVIVVVASITILYVPSLRDLAGVFLTYWVLVLVVLAVAIRQSRADSVVEPERACQANSLGVVADRSWECADEPSAARQRRAA